MRFWTASGNSVSRRYKEQHSRRPSSSRMRIWSQVWSWFSVSHTAKSQVPKMSAKQQRVTAPATPRARKISRQSIRLRQRQCSHCRVLAQQKTEPQPDRYLRFMPSAASPSSGIPGVEIGSRPARTMGRWFICPNPFSGQPGSGLSPDRCNARASRSLGSHLAQRRLGLIGADRCGDVVAGAPITKKSASCVKAWLAAYLDIHQRSVEAHGRVDEVAERLMRVEHRPQSVNPAVPALTKKKSLLTPLVVGIASVCVIAAVALWIFQSLHRSAPVDPAHLSMVVLPFANLSGDPNQDYFADGITENLTTDLSRIRKSFVIAPRTAPHLQRQERRRQGGRQGAWR